VETQFVKLGHTLRNFNWTTGSFIIGYHLALLVGLPWYFSHATPRLGTIVAGAVLLFLTEIGIGAAYHRYYAHRCYTLSKPAEGMLLFLATLATQGSALQWAHDHRRHHRFVDTDDDPYSITKGFWYAHVLWLFEKSVAVDPREVPDLATNRLVVFQHRWAGTLSILSNLVVSGAIGWLLDDLLGAFVLVWWTRLMLSHHLTWFVNSLAHCWGERTYSKEHSAVDNYVLALLTVGEGYHNYHHTFPSDYRNGVRWYHFDPTKWTIWTLSKLGLAGGLKRYTDLGIRRRLVREDHRLLLATLRAHAHQKRVELEQRVEQLSATLQAKMARVAVLAEELKRLRANRGEGGLWRARRIELRRLRRSLRRDFRDWSRLCGTILDPAFARA
jgi:stearoyl-CoA desaturase (delta-9 desaturase)